MYRDEDQFVLGQKVKLVICGMILIVLLVHHWITGVPILR